MRGDARQAERNRARTALALRAGAGAAWLVVGVCAVFGDLIHPVLRPDDGAAHTTVMVSMWLAYVLVLAAIVLPGPRALTVVRIGVPAGALLVALAASYELAVVVGLAAGLVGAIVVVQAAYAEAQVDASSYGDERRFLLRPPAPVITALVAPLWGISVAGVAAGPLLLADQGWAAGMVAAAVGLPAAALAAHSLFRLALRWLVFVPNGLVVHDHLAVAEPLPLGRRSVASIGPARADTTATDLTAHAFGIALELRFNEPVAASVRTGRNDSEERSVSALLVSLSRPAAALATAERRGIKIA